MITSKKNNRQKGFSLVELLVVMVVMGLVITAVYSLFINSNKTANTSEEVIDVQQNLRVAMDTLVGDIRMAGFLVDGDPILSMPNSLGVDSNDDGDFDDADDSGDYFRLQTCSSIKTYARILGDGTDKVIVAEDMASYLSDGNTIEVIRPSINAVIGQWDLSSDPSADGTNYKLPLTSYTSGSVEAGDIAVRKFAFEKSPAEIRYYLRQTDNAASNNLELIRGDLANDGTLQKSPLSNNIKEIDLEYLAEDGSSTADLEDIRAIRITITAETDEEKTAVYSGLKTRQLQTVVKIQNAFGG
ncbi:PilW family protein [Vibrio sp.]|uniref:PilW family protein n=1 Tax=Vibrio sp. TaxID=678 RepID=UPI003D10CF68